MTDQELLRSAELQELLDKVGRPGDSSNGVPLAAKQAIGLIFCHLLDCLPRPITLQDRGDDAEDVRWMLAFGADMPTKTVCGPTKLHVAFEACQAAVKEGTPRMKGPNDG